METLWYVIIALMMVAYVVLDGFDLGAGILHLGVAKSNHERRLVIKAIGPLWDGNEVWLLAAGGTLYFAYPMLYASSFSGFYLPLMMVLWLLMLRGVGIEFRSHIDRPVWQGFFDGIFSFSSALLAIFFGAALGNVLRGVPLNAEGYFFEPLWTNFRVGVHNGILDWYTVLTGVTAFVILMMHGALYLATKTEGHLNARARKAAAIAWWGAIIFSGAGLWATLHLRPQMLNNYYSYPLGWLIPLLVLLALGAIYYHRARGNDKAAFVSSSIYLAGMLGGAAFGFYPYLLPASTNPAYSLTVHNSISADYGLKVGLTWFVLGITLAIGYFVYLYRLFRGKVSIESEGDYSQGH